MCIDCDHEPVFSRRNVLAGTLGAAVAALPPVIAEAQALGDSRPAEVLHFPGAAGDTPALMVRPLAAGRHPVAIIAHGNAGFPDDIQYTARYLASSGFVAIIYDWASRAPMPEAPAARAEWQARLFRFAFIREQLGDLRALIAYVRAQPYASARRPALVGFCGGGRLALLAASLRLPVSAIVSLYGPVDYRDRVDAADPVPNIVAVTDRIRIPVQGHYGELDQVARPDDARLFERRMRARHAQIEMFYYPGAGHSFCNFMRPQGSDPGFDYSPEAARLAHARMTGFLRHHLA